jgi:primase-polymerase (primpol)-like protein
MPVTVEGRPASSVDCRTWTSYEVARSASVDGRLGFVLGAGVGCLDLDHALVGGVPVPWAERILDSLPGTYVEVSPSGDGLHVWGLLRTGPGRVVRDGRAVEIYSVARYMTVTGRRWGRFPLVLADLSGVVAGL